MIETAPVRPRVAAEALAAARPGLASTVRGVLESRRFARALSRFHRGLRPLLPRRHLPYRTRAGWIYLDVRESPMMLARALGVYEPDKHQLVRLLLGPRMTFVDVGANKGDFALFAARRLGGEGRVLAVEPEPTNCQWLRRSVRRNGYANVDVLELALSDEEGMEKLYLAGRSGWHSLVADTTRAGGSTIDVVTRRLDSVVAEAGIEPVGVLKIDVEGAELQVLRGAEGVLAGTPAPAILLDVHPALGIDPLEVAAFLRERGYELFSPRPPHAPLILAADTVEFVALRVR